jgi:hypothetical protein
MIIHNPILTGSLTLNNVNLSTGNLVTTGSNTFVGNQILSGSLTVSGSVSATGTLTAQTLVVQTVTSSVLYSSGSNIFGNNIANTQVMTGSVTVTGSLAVVTNGTEFQVGATGVNLGNALTDSHVISGSVRINPNGLFVSGSGLVGIGTTSPSVRLEVVGSGGIRVNEDGAGTKVISIRSDFAGVDPAINVSTNNALLLQTNNTERMRITSGGNVGIGTSNPGFTLHVLSTGASMGLFSTTSATGGFVGFRYNTSTTFGYIGNGNQLVTGGSVGDIALTVESGNILFATNAGAERMRIVSGGNVLIGSTSDGGEKLQVIGITRTTEGYRQDTGTVSINHNATTTIYSISGVRGLYIIYVSLPAGDAAAVNYSAYAIVSFDSSAARILQQTDGSNLFITLSGNNIQARQTSGNPQNVVYRLIKIV